MEGHLARNQSLRLPTGLVADDRDSQALDWFLPTKRPWVPESTGSYSRHLGEMLPFQAPPKQRYGKCASVGRDTVFIRHP